MCALCVLREERCGECACKWIQPASFIEFRIVDNMKTKHCACWLTISSIGIYYVYDIGVLMYSSRVYDRICVPKEVLNLFENAPEKLYPFTIVISVLCVGFFFSLLLLYFFLISFGFIIEAEKKYE